MQKKYLFILAAIVLISGTAVGYVYSSKPKSEKTPETKNTFEIPQLLERKGALANTAEWEKTKKQIAALMSRLKANPNDQDALLQLAYAYLEEARITGEHPYYYPSAMKIIDHVLVLDDKNFFALSAKASVLLSQHHFADAKEVALKTVQLYPSKATGYGALVDSYVELGDYDKAVEAADKMVAVRPDLNSYARVSYLRELFGDPKGAIGAMKMAVEAGYPGSEQEAWARYTLGKLYEQRGDLANAETQYMITLEQRPNYAFAIGGLGSIEKARKNYGTAIKNYEQALGMIPEFSFQEALTDLYTLTGDKDNAAKSEQKAISMLQDDAKSGHYANRELAYAYLRTSDVENAYKNAQIEYNRRPDNIGVNELMGWVLHKKGDQAGAEKYMETAMRTKSSDPQLLCRAGIIMAANGNKTKGASLIKTALKTNPYLPADLQAEAKTYL